ncbi:coth-domain-containing protein [Backusella circina FSU 941]|nr:coth-domain-containing protein [Backusella circina FSU 941]
MRYLTTAGIVTAFIYGVLGDDVQYSVVAFPSGNQGVSVSVGGQTVALEKSPSHQNIFTGKAPFGDTYNYILTGGQGNVPETTTRKLNKGATATGNEFFNRTQTVYSIPELPQAYNPINPTLMTNLNRSNEIATIIMSVNATELNQINTDPLGKFNDAHISEFAYISSKEVIKFQGAGLKTSGKSTKEFSKLSYAIDFGKYNTNNPRDLLYGRTTLKLRAEETDPTFTREKLALDMLAASGAVTLSASWTRVFINGEPFGLFLLMDDDSTHFIDNVLHGGEWGSKNTGPTYKGNALSDTQEGNLVYVGDDPANYPTDMYKLSDKGGDDTIFKNNSQSRLIEFIKTLSQINPNEATDGEHPGAIANLVDPQNTLIHMAMNFLIGSWDGFWYQASNYYLNQDLGTKKWTLITYDFDETFGNNLEVPGMNTVTYQNYSRPGSQRPLVTVFLNNTYYRAMFEDILKTLVKRFFKPSVVEPRLKAWVEMLSEDIAWTRSLSGKSSGTITQFTLEQFKETMTGLEVSNPSIQQWVSNRCSSLQSQLNFNDKDDLPALGPYTGGTHLDANGKVTKGSSPGSVSPSGDGSANGSGSNAKVHISGLLLSAAVASAFFCI